jgi:hypothetical protein
MAYLVQKISDQPSPIADLEHPFCNILINQRHPLLALWRNDRDIAEGCSKLRIGDG